MLKSTSSADILYNSFLFLSLIILLLTSWNAPISGDEYVHVKQAEKNINYIKTLGKDKEALNTPISRLKHYGQSFDTATTFIAQIISIDDLYRFRHVSNAIIAWLTIVFASFISFKISKSKIAAFITVLLFLMSLRFMGHAMNNLKDIPFAFTFIFSLYFMFQFLEKLPKISWIDIGLITLGLTFGISIRIGGLLIFAYFILFTSLYIYYIAVSGELGRDLVLRLSIKIGALSIVVFVFAYLIAILIWPWALENPIKNPWNSLALMHRYPTTVRQIFEGDLYWSEDFPWYYLFKYLFITLPAIALIGLASSLFFIWKLKENRSIIFSLFALIAFGFPLFYASVSGANVYGGWRQMLFVFPPLIVLSAIGSWKILEVVKGSFVMKLIGSMGVLILLYGPTQYFIANYPYQYTFFNKLVGGANGAFGNYELDYYFTSFKKAYNFIDTKTTDNPKIVAANFIIPEYYKSKSYKPVLIDYYDRSSVDWDYAIICNTFLDPYQLRNGFWPPSNTIYTEEIEGRPVMAILKRKSKVDLAGKRAFKRGDFDAAIDKMEIALSGDLNNESVRLNLARAYISIDDYGDARSVLKYFEKLYPTNEWFKELKGEIAMKMGDAELAIQLFNENIDNNYKFFHSYINLAKAFISIQKEDEAIQQLKTCLRINPFYKPAYSLYGKILIEQGNVELGKEMLNYSVEGDSKYGIK